MTNEVENNTEATELEPAPGVAYSSTAELTITLMVLASTTLWICLAHSIIIQSVWRHPRLHYPHNYLIASYSTFDILINVPNNVFSIGALLYDRPMPRWSCLMGSFPSVCSFFAIVYIIAVMAYERYRYFVHPLTYERFFSPYRTALVTGFVISVAILFTLVTEILIGRVYHESVLACHLPGTVYLNYIQISMFLVPSILVTIYSMVRIWNLSMAQRVAPIVAQTQAAAEGTSAGNTNSHKIHKVRTVNKVHVAFKAILLVSGCFWATYVPAFVIRTVLFTAGYTWHDMDTRSFLGAALGIRLVQLMIVHVSSIVNPFIYFYTNKALRMVILKTAGCKVTVEENLTTEASA